MTTLKKISLGFLAVLFLWVAGFGCFILTAMTMDKEQPERADAIVVFTGGANRIEEGLGLFSQKISKHLFITGINPIVTRADILKRSKEKLPKCCISYDLEASTTIENGIETKKWVEAQKETIKSLILVTSSYHMHRGAQEIQFALPDVTLYKYPVQAEGGWYAKKTLRLLFLEYHKFLYRAVMTRIEG